MNEARFPLSTTNSLQLPNYLKNVTPFLFLIYRFYGLMKVFQLDTRMSLEKTLLELLVIRKVFIDFIAYLGVET